MGQLNLRTLGFGISFGLLDAIALPIIKAVSKGLDSGWMIVPSLIYAAAPFIFLKALEHETMTIMNLVWDLTSDLIVTFVGVVVFAEKISSVKAVGIFFSMMGLMMMSYEGDGWNEFIETNFRKARDTFSSTFTTTG